MSAAATALKPRNEKKHERKSFDRPIRGYSKIPHWLIPVLFRHTRGAIEPACVLFVWSITDGFKGRTVEDFSPPITARRFAEMAGCTIESAEHTVKKITRDEGEEDDNALLERKALKKGYRYRVCLDNLKRWLKELDLNDIPDRAPLEAVDSGEELENDSRTEVRVSPKAFLIRKGKPQDHELLPDVKASLRGVRCESSADVMVDLVVSEDSMLKVIIEPKVEAQEGSSADLGDWNTPLIPKKQPPADVSFARYLQVATSAGLTGSREDTAEAYRLWRRLNFSDSLAAIQGILARIESGEFPGDPQFLPRIDNYIKKRIWERPIRPAKKSAAEEKKAKFESNYERGLAKARAVDAHIAKNGRAS